MSIQGDECDLEEGINYWGFSATVLRRGTYKLVFSMLIPYNMVVQAVFVCQVTWLSFYRDLALFNLAFFTQFSRSYFPYVLPFDFSKSIPVCVAVFQKYVELIFEGFLLKCS